MRLSRFTNIVGECNFPNANGHGRYLSQLERRGTVHLLLDPAVERFALALPKIYYTLGDGRRRRYTGDTLVEFHHCAGRRPLVIEYKYSNEFIRKPGLLEYYEKIREVLDRADYDFEIRTEKHVLTRSFRAKEFVCGYLNDDNSVFDNEVIRIVAQRGQVRLQDLLMHMRSDAHEQLKIVPAVWRLVARKKIHIGYDSLPSRETMIYAFPVNQNRKSEDDRI